MGSGFVQGVSLRDQGPNGPQCATFTTLRRFLEKFDLVKDSFKVHMDGTVAPLED